MVFNLRGPCFELSAKAVRFNLRKVSTLWKLSAGMREGNVMARRLPPAVHNPRVAVIGEGNFLIGQKMSQFDQKDDNEDHLQDPGSTDTPTKTLLRSISGDN